MSSFRRRALADWLVDTEHGAGQLLARVMVNRLWQHHLGRGIVGTPSDFGLQGELPQAVAQADHHERDLRAECRVRAGQGCGRSREPAALAAHPAPTGG